MNAPFYRKVEIAFWDGLIELMGHSKDLPQLMRKARMFAKSPELYKSLGIIMGGGLVGFLFGFILPQVIR